jgi:hypothetical protein
MFAKLSRAAENAAAGVGRREFLGRVGRGAAVFAGAIGGLLLTARDAYAGDVWCCIYTSGTIEVDQWCEKGRCPKGVGFGGWPIGHTTVRCRDWQSLCRQ